MAANMDALAKAVADTINLPKQNAVLILGFVYGGGEPPAPGQNLKKVIQNSLMEWGPNGAILHSLIDDPTVDALPRLQFELVPKAPGQNKVYLDMNLTSGYLEMGTIEADGTTKHSFRIDSTGIKMGGASPQSVLLASAADKYNAHTHAQDVLGAHNTVAQYAKGTSSEGVKFLAKEVGTLGNSISLVFNGTSDTVSSVTTAWNGANPTKLVAFLGDGAVKPAAQTVTLSGGAEAPTGVANGWGFANATDFANHMKEVAKLQQDVKNLMAVAYPQIDSTDKA